MARPYVRKADLTPAQLAVHLEAKKEALRARDRARMQRRSSTPEGRKYNADRVAAWYARDPLNRTAPYIPGEWNPQPTIPGEPRKCPSCGEEPRPLPGQSRIHCCRCRGHLWRKTGTATRPAWNLLFLDEMWDGSGTPPGISAQGKHPQ